jgi:PAS domain S-box-containing protein
MEHTSTYACVVDADGNVLGIGQRLAEDLGLGQNPQEAKGRSFAELVALPEERARIGALLHATSPIEKRDLFDTTFRPHDGQDIHQVRWAFVNTDADGFGNTIAMGWVREEWSRMQRQILNLSRVVEITSEAVVLVNSKGAVDYVNRSFCEMTGYAMPEMLGMPISALVSIPEDITVLQDALGRFRRDEMWKGSIKLRRKDGSVMFADIRVQPVMDTPGRGRRYLAVGADHSRQRTLERRIEELQRLESLGTLSNGLAHRFNNILAAISGQTELIIMSSKDPEVKKRAEKVLESALKGKEVVEQLGLFGRRTEPRSRLSDLVPVIRNAVRFIRAAQPRCVQIDENIPEESPEVMANTGEIHQVLVNLLANALEAIGSKEGTIKVTLRATPFQLKNELAPQDCVLIEVEDNGPGIPRDIQHRIFEPFFTTHGLANSSGMGLAITHGIVQRHGGIVQCISEEGHGALFRVAIPVFDKTGNAHPLASGARSSAHAPILFVDKEGFTLDSGKRVLEDLGYAVTATASIQEAHDFLGDRSRKFSLLITALELNAGSGVNLSRHSRRARPGMPVLLCANMRDTFDEEAALDAGASSILRRPAPREQLADIVAKLMDCNA